jgi:LPXTG-site transpeptidase (sortase) family protein
MNRRLLLVILIAASIALALTDYKAAGAIRMPVTPTPTPGVPVRLIIPKIGVDVSVEQVAEDKEGRMDVPKNPMDTGWWNEGNRPGNVGSAVIDGHLDLPGGKPGVFWNLKKLQTGDEINVISDDGKERTFRVTENAVYSDNNFPLNKVFAQGGGRWLNLITCEGTYDLKAHNYTDRLVIYSQME